MSCFEALTRTYTDLDHRLRSHRYLPLSDIVRDLEQLGVTFYGTPEDIKIKWLETMYDILTALAPFHYMLNRNNSGLERLSENYDRPYLMPISERAPQVSRAPSHTQRHENTNDATSTLHTLSDVAPLSDLPHDNLQSSLPQDNLQNSSTTQTSAEEPILSPDFSSDEFKSVMQRMLEHPNMVNVIQQLLPGMVPHFTEILRSIGVSEATLSEFNHASLSSVIQNIQTMDPEHLQNMIRESIQNNSIGMEIGQFISDRLLHTHIDPNTVVQFDELLETIQPGITDEMKTIIRNVQNEQKSEETPSSEAVHNNMQQVRQMMQEHLQTPEDTEQILQQVLDNVDAWNAINASPVNNENVTESDDES